MFKIFCFEETIKQPHKQVEGSKSNMKKISKLVTSSIGLLHIPTFPPTTFLPSQKGEKI